MIIPDLKNIRTKKIVIKDNVIFNLQTFIDANFKSTKGCVICDANTHEFIENLADCVCLDISSYHADEYMIEACDESIKDKNYDYFIACGAGTIHDITRVIACKYNKPFISFPTAASCDGFVSSIAPVTSKSGMKLTLQSVAPVALFADISILANAPRRLTAAGMGDLLGKYTALADWRIANLLLGEEIDKRVIELEYAAIERVVGSASCRPQDLNYGFKLDNHRQHSGDPAEEYKKFCAELLEALVLSGLCMQSMGNSRPASGAEHHIAHLLEMDILCKNNKLHGENVATGIILCAEHYKKLAAAPHIKFIENYAVDEDLIKRYYGDLACEIIKENAPVYLNKITPEIFCEKLTEIREIIKDIPAADKIRKILEAVGFIHTTESELALELAPYVRNRFTLLKLCRCLEF